MARPLRQATTRRRRFQRQGRVARQGGIQTESAAKTETTAKPDPKKPEASADVKADSKAKPEAEQYPPLTFGPPRIDFFQGADQQLYLRTWRAGEVTYPGPLKMGESGGRITAFRDTPDAVVLWFGDFHRPIGRVIRPVP